MKSFISNIALVLVFSVTSQAQVSLNDVMSNTAATHQQVAGLKNFRVVIPGVLYRGGNSGGGQVPLKAIGLDALSQKGFTAAVYMYPHGWNQRPTNTQGIDYSFIADIKNRSSQKEFLLKVKNAIVEKTGPIYVHCWNGWHASGEMATYALMQFCGLNNQQGQQYWNANVPQGDANKIMRMSRFQRFQDADLQISAEDAARVCPR